MATTQEFADKVCRRMAPFGDVRSRKMFGEYMVYVNERPVLTLCDNRVFVKKLPQVAVLMADAECGYPYEGAKEAYLLDLGDDARIEALLPRLVEHTPLPRPRKKKTPELNRRLMLRRRFFDRMYRAGGQWPPLRLPTGAAIEFVGAGIARPSPPQRKAPLFVEGGL